MILIDFQGGTHGRFLEFTLNVCSGILVDDLNIFNSLGASHIRKLKDDERKFISEHASFIDNPEITIDQTDKIILITIDVTDLPILVPLSLQRAGDANIRLDTIDLDNFYNSIELNSNMAREIIPLLKRWDENKDLSAECPKVDKNSLRELLMNAYDSSNGYLKKQANAQYPESKKVFNFPFSHFYDKHQFKSTVMSVLDWAGIIDPIDYCLDVLHNEFLDKNIFKHITALPTYYFNEVIRGRNVELIGLNIFQEAYLNFLIKETFNKKILFYHTNGKYFKNTIEIRKCYDL